MGGGRNGAAVMGTAALLLASPVHHRSLLVARQGVQLFHGHVAAPRRELAQVELRDTGAPQKPSPVATTAAANINNTNLFAAGWTTSQARTVVTTLVTVQLHALFRDAVQLSQPLFDFGERRFHVVLGRVPGHIRKEKEVNCKNTIKKFATDQHTGKPVTLRHSAND